MRKVLYWLPVILLSTACWAEDAEFSSKTSLLTIPQTKVDGNLVYDAKLLYKGNNIFELQSYQTTPPMNDDIPPPGNATAVNEWLAKGSYKNWSCETERHPARSDSAHGSSVRICSNSILSTSASGPYPVGAASVKELYSGATISGYALGVKIKAGTGRGNWYWFERFGNSIAADAVDAGICENCHSGADNTSGGRDRVFIRVAR